MANLTLNKNDVVLLGSSQQIGVIKYVGPLQGKEDEKYVGIEIGEGNGGCSGSFQGEQYFTCPENKGMFVPLDDIKKKLAAHQILKQMYRLSEKNRAQRATISELRDKLTLAAKTVEDFKFQAAEGNNEESREQAAGPAAWLSNECTKKWWVGFDDFQHRYRETPNYSKQDLQKDLQDSGHGSLEQVYQEQKPKLDGFQENACHTRIVYTVCASSKDNLLASGSDDKTIRLWRRSDAAKTGARCIDQITLRSCINAISISPDGSMMAAALDSGWIELYDLGSGKMVGALEGQTTSEVWTVCFSPDGKNIISGALDRAVRIWDVQARECRWALRGHDEWVNGVSVSPNGNHIVSGSGDKTVRVWDTKTMKCTKTFRGHQDFVRSVCVLDDSNLAVSASDDCQLRVWNIKDGKCQNILGGSNAKGHSKGIYSVSAGKGKHVASASRDASVMIWDVGQAQPLKKFTDHRGDVNSCVIFNNGRSVASGSDDKSVIVKEINL